MVDCVASKYSSLRTQPAHGEVRQLCFQELRMKGMSSGVAARMSGLMGDDATSLPCFLDELDEFSPSEVHQILLDGLSLLGGG